MLPQLSEQTIFTKLYQFVKAYNKGKALKDRIKGNVCKTFETILFQYIKNYRKTARSFKDGMNDLPAYYTNRPSLSRLTFNATSTIGYHMQRLVKAGLIYKKWHGRQADFEMWINPYLLFDDEFLTELKNRENTAPAPNLTCLLQNLSPINFKNLSNNVIRQCGKVEKSDNVCKLENSEGFKDTKKELTNEHEQPTGTNGETNSNLSELQKFSLEKEKIHEHFTQGGSPRKDKRGHKQGEEAKTGLTTPAKAPDSQKNEKLELVKSFWAYARFICYPHYKFTDEEQRKILNLIWENVFYKFQDPKIQDWKAYYDNAIKRIDMAKLYTEKNEAGYIVHPKLYFSKDFSGRFQNTIVWLIKAETTKKLIEAEKLKEKAVKDYQKGEMRGKKKSKLEIFSYYENRLKKLNNEQILKAYYNACIYYNNLLKSNP